MVASSKIVDPKSTLLVVDSAGCVSEVGSLAGEGFEEGADDFKLNPNHVPISWSSSRADTADQCAYKYYNTYILKEHQSTHALNLGSFVHDVQAKQLVAKNTSVEALIKELDEMTKTKFVEPEAYAMVPNIVAFTKKYVDLCNKDSLEFTIEKKYGMTRDFKDVGFFGKEVYLRYVIDMWCYDSIKNRLIVIDHKTNKSALGPKAVHDYPQLSLYVWSLTQMYGLKWDSAHIALHFLRHGKIVWSTLEMEDVMTFGKRYTNYLQLLDDKVSHCEAVKEWPREVGHHCNWCGFKSKCTRFIPEKKKKEDLKAELGIKDCPQPKESK